jgi:hypothetical protein
MIAPYLGDGLPDPAGKNPSVTHGTIALKVGEVISNAPLQVNARLGSTFEQGGIQRQRRLERGHSDAFLGAINNQDRILILHKAPRPLKPAQDRACNHRQR